MNTFCSLESTWNAEWPDAKLKLFLKKSLRLVHPSYGTQHTAHILWHICSHLYFQSCFQLSFHVHIIFIEMFSTSIFLYFFILLTIALYLHRDILICLCSWLHYISVHWFIQYTYKSFNVISHWVLFLPRPIQQVAFFVWPSRGCFYRYWYFLPHLNVPMTSTVVFINTDWIPCLTIIILYLHAEGAC